jgi:hypothetical protein
VPYILRKLPFFQGPTLVRFPNGPARVKAYQIIIWISITESTRSQLDPTVPRFPAILDTGHSHNLSIRQQHLLEWAKVNPLLLPSLGQIRVSGQRVNLFEANLWIHPNQPGKRDELASKRAVSLEVDGGIAVFADNIPAAPRLPLIGVRSLVQAKLRLSLDGWNCQISIRTKKRFWFFG